MEFIIALATKFWQWSILIAVVIIGAIINFADKKATTKLKFYYKGMPKLQPIPIKTKGKGFWKGIIMWLLATMLVLQFPSGLLGAVVNLPWWLGGELN